VVVLDFRVGVKVMFPHYTWFAADFALQQFWPHGFVSAAFLIFTPAIATLSPEGEFDA